MRRFDLSLDEPAAADPSRPDEWITPLDRAGKRLVGPDWFGPAPEPGDRVGGHGQLVVVKVERFANGVCAWTRPLFADGHSSEDRAEACLVFHRLAPAYPEFAEAHREERSRQPFGECREAVLVARLIECDRVERQFARRWQREHMDQELAAIVRGRICIGS